MKPTQKLPSLADAVHSWTYRVDSPIKSGWLKSQFEAAALDLRIALRKARRFTLDDQFVREVVRRASTTTPEKMLHVSDLANLPYEAIFFEYDNVTRIKAQKEAGTMRHETEIQDEHRGTAGWLLERYKPDTPGHWRATYFSMDDKFSLDGKWCIGAAQYIVNLDGVPDALGAMIQESGTQHEVLREIAQGYPWGYAVQTAEIGDDFIFVATTELARRGIALPEPRFMKDMMSYVGADPDNERGRTQCIRLYANSCYEGRGDLRFICTALAMLNHVPTTFKHREAKGSYKHRLRNIPYLSNSTISIHAGRARTVTVVDNAFKNALGALHRKAHPVRGHWRDVEYGKAVRCAHEPIERDGNYCLCGRCGHLLRWIDHYTTGDASEGFVIHDYEVKL
jgi:hypothetical protein